ncbi:beta-hexosaminidase-like [Mercenaria mercenaria]|uniref:beta-hexosaminidase-like n=1 Tax=Mercenaria mercenaria TaxID=6596 RepID=UPI00234EDD85|nr:beta-hexosaminidase-like [Mercenaria mercenaria]XP_053378219.1 beta-hexosaminidase-like [Mercenaria mercenaria]
MDQETLDEFGRCLDIRYKVLDNLTDGKKTYRAQIVLTNKSERTLKYGDWAIYFCHIRMIEPGHLPHSTTYEIHDTGMRFTHVNGCLFKLSPTKKFQKMEKGDTLKIKFKAQYFSVARSDLMPNWYLLFPKLRPVLIQSTVGEEMSFVEPFDNPDSWKRFDYELTDGSSRYDHYNPYNLQERFDRQCCANVGPIKTSVIPTPVKMSVNEEIQICLSPDEWVVCAEESLNKEAKFLSEKLNIPVNNSQEVPHKITLQLSSTLKIQDKAAGDESYKLTVKADTDITVTAVNRAGIFYGIQTLLSLVQSNKVPDCDIEDFPRYPYRGMHMDVSRNFHGKEQILKLLDVMAMYKMNKFHFHLTDDEGWRLEIPGLEELTQVGARRGHVNKTDLSSLLPLLGSGPGFDTSGSGYYSVEEYREILRYAKLRHIEVIPEIDMPGHSHAAIRSMKARHQKYMAEKAREKAEEYLLSDLDHDTSCGSHSVQMYSENAMNPGMESTYKFVKKVVTEVKKMHEDIMPLQTFHFGGDEVPYEAWEGSPACMSLIDSEEVKSSEDLMEYFVSRVADIVAKCDLDVGAWQDGIFPDETDLVPIARHKFKSKNVYVYAWQNVWESGLSGCAYRLANSGYKVVMSQGTHLYFDHPYEPDPEERGLYWACRFCDARKTFTFMPDNIYANVDVKLTGEQLSKDYIRKHKEDHDDLKKPENVTGIQAQLWTELVRTWDQMDSMIFPRLLCVAERAWHKSDWELEPDKEKIAERQFEEWSSFAHKLGSKELARLDKMGVAYHLPPPGAHCLVEECKLEFNSAYPGLPIFYSTDKGETWTRYTTKIDTIPDKDVYLCTKSVDEKRTSRTVIMEKPRKD